MKVKQILCKIGIHDKVWTWDFKQSTHGYLCHRCRKVLNKWTKFVPV